VLSPGYLTAHENIGLALLLGKGDAASALQEMQAEPDELGRLQGLAITLYTLQRKAESDAALVALSAPEQDSAFFVATVYAWRGENDRAFEWLNKAVTNQDPNVATAPLEPLLDQLHADPRWLPFLRGIGKTPEQLAKIGFKVTLPAAEGPPQN
jgi:hypothetical protein